MIVLGFVALAVLAIFGYFYVSFLLETRKAKKLAELIIIDGDEMYLTPEFYENF